MKKRNWFLLTGVVLMVAIVSACSTPTPTTQATEPAATSTATALPPAATATTVVESTSVLEPTAATAAAEDTPTATPEPPTSETEESWTADGVIGENEYTSTEDFSGLRFWWKNDARYLYFAIEGDTTGWVAVGFDPQNRMQGANYIFGYVTADGVEIWDAYGTAPTGATHPPDDELGGTTDIVTFAGLEQDGVTRLEVQIPLDSGDDYDKVMVPGESYRYIIAMGGEDSFNAYHLKYAGGQLDLTP